MADRKKILTVKIEEEEAPKDVSFNEWIKAKVDKIFTDNIPISSIKDMGGAYMYIGGVLAYSFFFSCFVYFVWTVGRMTSTKKSLSCHSKHVMCSHCISFDQFTTVDSWCRGTNKPETLESFR